MIAVKTTEVILEAGASELNQLADICLVRESKSEISRLWLG